MKIIDRYVVRNFLISTALWFLIMMSLRIVVDLFINMDEFAEKGGGVQGALWHICSYYGYQSMVYVAEMGGLIVLFGAVTTLFLMSRSNELIALLASGVSLHRVVWPIVVHVSPSLRSI